MPPHTKSHGKRSLRRHRHGRRAMKGGFLQALSPSLYTDSTNAIGTGPYETATVGTLNQQLQHYDSGAYSHSNALDYKNLSQPIMSAAHAGASAMHGQSSQTGGNKRRQQQQQQQQQQQNQRQYQNQQGGVWNQMIGDAVAPLVLLGLQQYYGPRSKTRMHKKSYKGKMTRKYRK